MATAEKNGRWYIVESRPVIIDGKKVYKQKWIPTEATNKEEADEMERNYKKKRSRGIKVDPNMTVYQLSQTWMERHVKSPVKPLAEATQNFYQDNLDNHIIPVIGAKLIRKLTIDDLDDVLITCAKKGGEDTTLRAVYSTMSAMFNWAESKRLIDESLMEYVDRPEVAEREYVLLQAEDIPKLLNAVLTPNKSDTKYAIDQRTTYYRMFLVELTTALRIDELCGMMVKDIDFDRKIYHVRTQVVKAGSKPKFGPAKDRKYKLPDIIPLADMVIEELKDEIEYNKIKKAEAEKKGLKWTEYGLVFTNRTGGPIDSKNLNTRTFKTALKKAGLPPMKFHNLRHSVLTILTENNEDPNVICNLARHADYNYLKSRYLHKTSRNIEAQRSASRTLEALVKSEVASAKENG